MKFDLDVTSDGSSEAPLSKQQRTSGECIPLLEAAHLNIYRENAFRITGLPVDASEKQADRRANELKMMQEAGQTHGANSAAFALDPSPSVDQIRDAMRRLKEPEQRLIDEFFWFWPKTFGESANDPAIQALLEGDTSKAYEIWTAQEADPATGFVATHNIAVMLHLVALDWTLYHINAEVDEEREEKIRNYWKESFQRWEKIPSDDRVWDAVKARIRSVEDRLTTGFARRMCGTLPNALDKINAEAALKFAEQGRLDWARAHVEFMRETHQGLDDVEKTADLVLTPIRNRVQQHIRTAREMTQKDPKKGGEAAKLLIGECTRLHFLYELFHGKDAHQKTELFDEVVAASIDCLVDYQKATGDNQLFVEVLRATVALASAIDVRERIQKNISIGEGNIRGEALQPLYDRLKRNRESKLKAKLRLSEIKQHLMPELAALAQSRGADSELVHDFCDALAGALRGISIDAHNDEKDFQTSADAVRLAAKLVKDPELKEKITDDLKVVEESLKNAMCFYCGKTASEPTCASEVAMFGEVQSDGSSVHFRHTKVTVPRCRSCAKTHRKQTYTFHVIWVACLLLGTGIGAASADDGWFLGGLGGAFGGLLISLIVKKIMRSSDGLRSHNTYPRIIELRAKGWKFGNQPGKSVTDNAQADWTAELMAKVAKLKADAHAKYD